MWKPPSEPIVKPPQTKSVTATSLPVKVPATTTGTPPTSEHGAPPIAKITTPARASADSPVGGAPVRKRIPIKIVDDKSPGVDKNASRGITTSNAKASRKIEEIRSSPVDPPKTAPKGIVNPAPASPQAPPRELSAFLTEVSSRPVSAMRTNTGPSSKVSSPNDQSRTVRVGGGIWKKGGDNRSVLTERVLERDPPKQTTPGNRGDDEDRMDSNVLNGTSTKFKSVKSLPSQPATLFELERGWKACEGVGDRWELLKVCP
jgi:hypothetical protein